MPKYLALQDQFRLKFGRLPKVIARAPGRVNLIGEHVDYNGGFVMPVAIDREVVMLAALRNDGKFALYSAEFDERIELQLDRPLHPVAQDWVNYFQAVAAQFRAHGLQIPSADIYVTGDVPLGAGLSSSAAFCVCAAILIDALDGTNLPPREIALMAQAAERSSFIGVNCGIMDQFISALGEADKAVLIDCHTLEYELVPFDSSSATILVINSMKQRQLVTSEYNKRREECENGLLRLRALSGTDFPTLRHVPLDVFLQHESGIWGAARRRVRHNITENQRVLDFAAALRQGDFSAAGKLLFGSHESLRTDFEVSCEELDAIVEIATACEGVYGARMTGAGFGGCAMALVQPARAEAVASEIRDKYRQRFGITPDILSSPPARGGQAFSARETIR